MGKKWCVFVVSGGNKRNIKLVEAFEVTGNENKDKTFPTHGIGYCGYSMVVCKYTVYAIDDCS